MKLVRDVAIDHPVDQLAWMGRYGDSIDREQRSIMGSVTGARPPIPRAVKREVRQRCGFGCVICGQPLYEYDHVVPYPEVQEHNSDNIVLLCNHHHSEKTKGLLPTKLVEDANRNPKNRVVGQSHPYILHYSGTGCETVIGPSIHTWPSLSEDDCTIPLMIDDTPIVRFQVEAGNLLLTVQLLDMWNRLRVQIVENELVYSVTQWDVEFVGSHLTIRHAPEDIFLSMKFDPPSRILIDRGRFWRNGLEIKVSPNELILPGNNKVSEARLEECAVGILVVNPELPILMGIDSSDTVRTSFPRWPRTESRIIRAPEMIPDSIYSALASKRRKL